MGRVLVRSGMSPFDVVPYDRLEEHIGGNAGNLIYAFGVYRMLSVDGSTELVSTDYRLDYTPEEIARINEEFECFVIPLADAFRPGYAKRSLPALTRIVKALRIPCVVVGVGLAAPYEPGLDFRFPFDGEVRDFIAAVLEKSTIVGLRGEITGDYLAHLGFRPESDFTVIGCPSMYAYGEAQDLSSDAVELHPETRVSFCMSQGANEEQIGFIRNNVRRLSDAVYLPQRGEELRMMRTGQPYLVKAADGYPVRITDELIGMGRFFGSAKAWIDFQRTRQLCFGTRVHGNISAVLAGIPAVFMPFDARGRELVAYHHFAHIPPESVQSDQRLEDWIAKLDFAALSQNHARNLCHYVHFLDLNGIKHIYRSADGGKAFDEKLAAVDFLPPLRPIVHGSPDQIAAQLDRLWQENPAWRRQKTEFELKNVLRGVKRNLISAIQRK